MIAQATRSLFRTFIIVLKNLILIVNSYAPSSLRNRRDAETLTAIRGGLQLLLGGVFSFLGAYIALTLAAENTLAPFARVGIAAAVAATIVVMDSAFISKLNQIRAERESKRFKFASPRTRFGIGLVLLLPLIRAPQALLWARIVSVFILMALDPAKISALLSADAELANRPVLATIKVAVDAEIESRRLAAEDANKHWRTLVLPPSSGGAPPLSAIATASSFADQVKQLETTFAAVNERLAAITKTLDAEKATLATTRRRAIGCDSPARLDCPAARIAIQRASDAVARAATAKTDATKEVNDTRATLDDAARNRANAAENDASRQERANGLRHDEVAAARKAADDARTAYLDLAAKRETTIAARMDKTIERKPVETGFFDRAAAVSRLDGQHGSFAFYLSILLCIFEMNAILTACLYAPRLSVHTKEYTDFITDSEDDFYTAERHRRQKPPLDAFGK